MQIVWFALAVPPIDGGVTIMVTKLDVAEGQMPFVTTAW